MASHDAILLWRHNLIVHCNLEVVVFSAISSQRVELDTLVTVFVVSCHHGRESVNGGVFVLGWLLLDKKPSIALLKQVVNFSCDPLLVGITEHL